MKRWGRLSLALAVVSLSLGSAVSTAGPERVFAGLRERVANDPHKIVVSFREDLEHLLRSLDGTSIDAVDLQLLHGRYMANLRETYFRKYLSQLGSDRSAEEVAAEILRDCRATMTLSTPVTADGTWSFEGYLSELEEDMSRHREETAAAKENVFQPEARSVKATWRGRLKWLASQALLLLVNVLQNEWHRRATRRAAEKRLAEVPEFPLL